MGLVEHIFPVVVGVHFLTFICAVATVKWFSATDQNAYKAVSDANVYYQRPPTTSPVLHVTGFV